MGLRGKSAGCDWPLITVHTPVRAVSTSHAPLYVRVETLYMARYEGHYQRNLLKTEARLRHDSQTQWVVSPEAESKGI